MIVVDVADADEAVVAGVVMRPLKAAQIVDVITMVGAWLLTSTLNATHPCGQTTCYCQRMCAYVDWVSFKNVPCLNNIPQGACTINGRLMCPMLLRLCLTTLLHAFNPRILDHHDIGCLACSLP